MENIEKSKLCRICLENEKLQYIFDFDIAKKIMDCASVNIKENDGLPQYICSSCVSLTDTTYNFIQQCQVTDAKLRSDYSETEIHFEDEINFPNEDDVIGQKNSPEVSSEKNLLSIHEKWHTKQNTSSFTCTECSKEFKTSRNLKLHFQIHLFEKKFECTYCSKRFRRSQTLKHHEKIHLNERNFKCNICNKSFVISSTLKAHIIKTHKKQRTRYSNNKKFLCEYCGNLKSSLTDLEIHARMHSGEKPYQCQKCQKTFRIQHHLQMHETLHQTTAQNTLSCFLCYKTFKHSNNLRLHLRVHTNHKQFPCTICERKFNSNRTLTEHLKIHTGERNYPCSECNKSFINRFDLKRHIAVHTKRTEIAQHERKIRTDIQCENCGKFFQTNSDLRKHHRIHTGERPYVCTYCGKNFINSSGLARHVRIHTGQKPFTCQHCGRTFSQSSNFKSHVRVHTGEKVYFCTMCPRGFNRKRDLKAHIKTHIISNDNKNDKEVLL